MKNIIKKSFTDICVSLTLILISTLLASLFPYVMSYTPAQRLFFYDLLFRYAAGLSVFSVAVIVSHHFIMQTELFSASKAYLYPYICFVHVFRSSLGLLSVFPFPRCFQNLYFNRNSIFHLYFRNSNDYLLCRRR